MHQTPKKTSPENITRRKFVSSSAALGTGLALANNPLKAFASPTKKDDLNIAIIGFGSQGEALFESINKIPTGIRFKAICDIWPNNRKKGDE